MASRLNAMTKWIIEVTVLFGGVMCCRPCFGCYSGLVTVPTADTVENGRYSVELQTDFVTPISSETSSRFINTEFGAANHLELGLDLDLSNATSGRVNGNGKYVFDLGHKDELPLAIGFSRIDGRFNSDPYVALSHRFKPGRLHLGAIRSDGKTRWFTGVDRTVGRKWTLMADYASGDENFLSFGANYVVSPRFSIVAGVQFPNEGSRDTVFTVHLVTCGTLNRAGGKRDAL
jgi:hypothetical protein